MKNKSIATNVIALLVILLGLTGDAYWQHVCLITGMFALSGALTNWLAVHMLFERVPGLYGSGVIPTHFEEFKQGIKKLVMEQFFNEKNLNEFFSKSEAEVENGLEKVLSTIDFDQVFDSLTEVILSSSLGSMLGMFGGEKALESLRKPFATKLSEVIKDLAHSKEMKEKLRRQSIESLLSRIEPIVEQRLEQLTPELVKEIVQAMIRKHLGWLVVWGGVFGGLIGLLTAVFFPAF